MVFILFVTTEDEHDVVWFWLEKGKHFECPVCTQYFKVSHRHSRLSKYSVHYTVEL